MIAENYPFHGIKRHDLETVMKKINYVFSWFNAEFSIIPTPGSDLRDRIFQTKIYKVLN